MSCLLRKQSEQETLPLPAELAEVDDSEGVGMLNVRKVSDLISATKQAIKDAIENQLRRMTVLGSRHGTAASDLAERGKALCLEACPIQIELENFLTKDARHVSKGDVQRVLSMAAGPCQRLVGCYNELIQAHETELLSTPITGHAAY